ncbi:RBBP9/YdeN family alpha/beta hydrolase [Demequina phytophila]|uniref:RBBP9/YdeN family alpha/beta hydrolase n=1 Tax=Demequina phytophila TaxID=1638981 RepID=UPI000AD94038|nr:alpha/beta fold hydrolase [Demequina phytophila]
MTDTRVLLLHGYEHTRPAPHWLRWLAASLRKSRVPVQYPQLPAPGAPEPEAWADVARTELEMLAEGRGERVVVTHSLGGILWRRLAPTLDAALLPSRVLMVAPPSASRLAGPLAGFAAGDDAPAGSDGPPTLVVARERDPYRDGEVATLAHAWGAGAVELPGTGHLNPDDGHGPWASALDWVLDGDARWRLGEGARSLDA